MITLKLATSLDGRIATASGESRWITGEAAREQSHQLRADHEAILVGVETVIADDPQLTARLPGENSPRHQPRPVVFDSRQRTPTNSKLVMARRGLVVVSVHPGRDDLLHAGVEVITVPPANGHTDVRAAVHALNHKGLSTLMVEGGGRLAAAFLRAGLIDRIEWFRAPLILGAEGRPAVADLYIDALADGPRFKRLEVSSVGEDLWERYERA